MSDYVRAYIAACEAYGWEGGPEFSTAVVQLRSGRERRNAQWAQPRFYFSLPFQNISSRESYASIYQMFMAMRGKWGTFLYRHPTVNEADDELFAVAEAGQTTFQLGKWSIVEGVTFYHEVHALYAPASDGTADEPQVDITVDGSPAGTHAIDRDTGILEFDTPMTGGEIIRWSGEFSFWVRFDNDRLPFTIDNRNRDDYILNGQIDLLEMPPPPVLDSSGS